MHSLVCAARLRRRLASHRHHRRTTTASTHLHASSRHIAWRPNGAAPSPTVYHDECGDYGSSGSPAGPPPSPSIPLQSTTCPTFFLGVKKGGLERRAAKKKFAPPLQQYDPDGPRRKYRILVAHSGTVCLYGSGMVFLLGMCGLLQTRAFLQALHPADCPDKPHARGVGQAAEDRAQTAVHSIQDDGNSRQSDSNRQIIGRSVHRGDERHVEVGISEEALNRRGSLQKAFACIKIMSLKRTKIVR